MTVTEVDMQKIEYIVEYFWGQDCSPEAVVEEIREVLGVPKQTMEGVEWSDEEHYLAEVETMFYGKLAMIAQCKDGEILCAGFNQGSHPKAASMQPVALTPTGRKWQLTPGYF